MVQQVPIIMMSAGTNPVDRAKYIEEGAEDFVTKPFNSIELLARCRRVLARASGHIGVATTPGTREGTEAVGQRVTELTRGKLGEMQGPDLVQFFMLGQKDGFLEFTRPTATARMFFVGGQVVHCTVVERTGISREGEDAVYNMLSWKEGNFRAAFERVAIPRRIKVPTHELLLEHARRADDMSRQAAEAAAVSGSPSGAPGAAPSTGAGGATPKKEDFNF
jgi:hypothetical protein